MIVARVFNPSRLPYHWLKMAGRRMLPYHKYVCYACGSTKTYIDLKGVEHWCINSPTDLVLCKRCKNRHIENILYRPILNQKKHERYNKNWLLFKGKYIYINWLCKLKTGMCSDCGQSRRTNLHHWVYVIIFPWYGLEELCVPCHNRRRIGFHYKKTGKVVIN